MKLLKLGFTGNQHGMNPRQQAELRHHLNRWLASGYTDLEIHHGDCVGSDEEFHTICTATWTEGKVSVVLHPPDKQVKRAYCTFERQVERPAKPYLIRNQDIVGESMGMLAAPREMEEQVRSGTWATVRRARKAEVPIIILWVK